MSTITCKVHLTKTDKRFSKRVLDVTGSHEASKFSQVFVSIGATDDPSEHNFSNMCVAYFPFLTLIQLVVGGVTTEVSVEGPLVLPFAGKLVVSHPGGGLTSPVEYDIFTS